MLRNPAHGVKPPAPRRHELTVPTLDQARAFIQAADAHRLRALWILLALTGMRRGEALTLKWSDIDWAAHTLVVQRTLSRHAANRRVEPTKTHAGARRIALSEYLITVLRAHEARQEAVRAAAGARWHDDGWVFTTRNGTWIAPGHFYDYFKDVAALAKLPDSIRPHDLRHAMATHWLASGVNPKVVSERLGHSSIAITLGLYGHALPHMQAEAAEAMDTTLVGVSTASVGAQRNEAFGDNGETPRGRETA